MDYKLRQSPTVLVIFGGGDLTWRKLIPALFNLCLDNSLPQKFAVRALDRVESSDDALRQRLREGVAHFSRRGVPSDADWNGFATEISYQ